jgi:hypothetical protein
MQGAGLISVQGECVVKIIDVNNKFLCITIMLIYGSIEPFIVVVKISCYVAVCPSVVPSRWTWCFYILRELYVAVG